MFNINHNLNEAQGAREVSSISAGADTQPGRRLLGWQHQDTLCSYEQNQATSPSWYQTWYQSIGDWFSGNNREPVGSIKIEDVSNEKIVTVADSNATAKIVETSEPGHQDAIRIQSKFDKLMAKLKEDNIDMDQFLELLFVCDQEINEKELETRKAAFKEKLAALEKHREKYGKLAEDLAQDLKSTFKWKWGQEVSTAASAIIAAASFGSGWVLPVAALSIGKLASSYYGDAGEHGFARLVAKTGIVSEQSVYNLAKGGLDALFLLGAVLGGGAKPSELVQALKQLASFTQMATTLGNEYVNYQSEQRKSNVQFVSTEIQDGETGVERAMQDIESCSRRSSQMASHLGEWASNLDRQKKALMS